MPLNKSLQVHMWNTDPRYFIIILPEVKLIVDTGSAHHWTKQWFATK